jgi:hypothetical protein
MPDFDQIEKDVVTRIRMLKAAYEKLPKDDIAVINDSLVIPCMSLLAEFCACISITEEEDDG